MFSDSQNSPSLVAPSPVVDQRHRIRFRIESAKASAHPTACRNCVPVGEEVLTIFSAFRSPMRRHLPSARSRIGCGADRAQHVFGVTPSARAQRAIAVIEIEPVVTRPHAHNPPPR